MISHPFMSPTQPRDSPRHPLVVHDETFIEPDHPQQSVAAVAMAQPHAVVQYIFNCQCYSFYVSCIKCKHFSLLSTSYEAWQAIAERLERLINLRVVTKGTKAYTISEECLRIARGVIAQQNVYVR